jgi:hypothetical protein
MQKPGGQKGNQNARIHGYYSKILDREERRYYRQAVQFEGLDGEIVLLRVKLKSLIAHDPQNVKLISQAVNSLTRMVLTKYSTSKPDKAQDQQQRFIQARQNVLNYFEKELGIPLFPNK